MVSVRVLGNNLNVDSRVNLAVDHCGLCHYRRHVACHTQTENTKLVQISDKIQCSVTNVTIDVGKSSDMNVEWTKKFLISRKLS